MALLVFLRWLAANLVYRMADPDPDPAPDPPEPKNDPPDPKPDPPELGDAGKKALDEERKARKAAEKAVKDAQAELDKLRQDAMSEQEKAIAAARTEARVEVLTAANKRLISAEVRAAAAGKLKNPALAVRLLDLETFEVDDDGEVDSEAINEAIKGLLEENPELAVGATPQSGNADQGPRTPPKPQDLDDAIREAEKAGDWNKAGRLKMQKIAALPRP